MLLRCHGYPQRQASIPGYRPAVPELLPGAWAGARAIWEQRRRGLEGLGCVHPGCTEELRCHGVRVRFLPPPFQNEGFGSESFCLALI